MNKKIEKDKVKTAVQELKELTDDAKSLKACMEVIEKLRARRKEVKNALAKEGLDEAQELKLSVELFSVANAIGKYEDVRKKLYGIWPPQAPE